VAQDASGREWTTPVYLRILLPGDENLLQAVNRWRSLVGSTLADREDLERSFECWQFGRYATKNWDNPDYPHTTDPRKPYWTPAADRCARGSQVPVVYYCYHPARPVPSNILGKDIDGAIEAPIHRTTWLSETVSPPSVWGGLYLESRPFKERPGGVCYEGYAGNNLSGTYVPKEILFPPPETVLSFRRFGGEWPNPVEACNATRAPKLPYRTTQDSWVFPAGLAITVMTSAPFRTVETEATFARLVRTSDGAEVPVCAMGSRQFWNQDPVATDRAVEYLRYYGMLLVIPKDPLDRGEEYEVEVRGLFNGSQKTYRWKFRIAEDAL
ncbi:MAG: hypothetical protein ACK4G4_12340, partial [Thermus sp.]